MFLVYAFDEQDQEIADRVAQLAKRRSEKPAQIALGWLLHKEDITSPIVGTRKIEQLEELTGALEINLSAEEMQFLQQPYRPRRISGHEYRNR